MFSQMKCFLSVCSFYLPSSSNWHNSQLSGLPQQYSDRAHGIVFKNKKQKKKQQKTPQDGTKEVAQLVEHLPDMHRTWDLIHSTS